MSRRAVHGPLHVSPSFNFVAPVPQQQASCSALRKYRRGCRSLYSFVACAVMLFAVSLTCNVGVRYKRTTKMWDSVATAMADCSAALSSDTNRDKPGPSSRNGGLEADGDQGRAAPLANEEVRDVVVPGGADGGTSEERQRRETTDGGNLRPFPGPFLELEIFRLERSRRRLRSLQAQVATTRDRVAALAKLQQQDASRAGDGDQELKALQREASDLGDKMRRVGDRLVQLRSLKKFRLTEKEVRKENERLEQMRMGPVARGLSSVLRVAKACLRVLGVAVPGVTVLRAVRARWTKKSVASDQFPSVPHETIGKTNRVAKLESSRSHELVKMILKRAEELFWMWISRRILQGDLLPKFPAAAHVPDVALEDVVGLGSVKREAAEIVQFLRAPARFDSIGAACPRGVLLTGPPGCGKTMLAKAIAASSGAPFLQVSGADFNHRYAGMGTSLVKDIFARARKMAPAIIFIDEIDYIGRRRSSQGGSVESDRTAALTQLLTELDGFKGRDGVVVVATTNRPDLMDAALLRPGRFDRQLVLPLPDVGGREKILRSRARRVLLDEAIDWATWARRTSGFSGADLVSLINEAAVAAAREEGPEASKGVKNKHLQAAYSKRLLGLPSERRPSDRRRSLTAFHEAGHAVVNEAMRAAFPEKDRDGFRTVEHVSILAQGDSGGNTQFTSGVEGRELPRSRMLLLAEMAGIMGGRAAEETREGPEGVTMGASSDLEAATGLAEQMVRHGGLGGEVGPRALAGHDKPSEALLQAADAEVGRLLRAAHAAAMDALARNRGLWEAVAQALLERESLDADAFRALVGEHTIAPGRPFDFLRSEAPAAQRRWLFQR